LIWQSFVFQLSLQIAECLEAGAFELADPAIVDSLKRHGVKEVQLLPTAPLHDDKVSGFEHSQVLRHSLPGHFQMSAKLAQRLPVVRVEAIHELSPARVG
jgi:hypothetical protein